MSNSIQFKTEIDGKEHIATVTYELIDRSFGRNWYQPVLTELIPDRELTEEQEEAVIDEGVTLIAEKEEAHRDWKENQI